MTVTPDELRGSYVRRAREAFGLSRREFSARCGFTGKTVARLENIERKDSWKPGDRERVAAALNLLGGHPGSLVELPPPAPAPAVDVSPVDDEEGEDDGLVGLSPPPVDLGALPVITNGQLQTFKRCRRKWWLAWYRQLALRETSSTDARATGTRVHRALEAWYVPATAEHTRVDPRDALERLLVEDRTRLIHQARQRGHDDFVIANLTHEFDQAASLERAVVEGYVDWLAETGADAELEILAPEAVVSVVVDVPRQHGTLTPVQLKGLLDARARRTTDGVRVFLDHKTVKDFASHVRTLHQNEQMLQYMLLEWLALAGTDERCDAALYNMLRKVKRTARATPPFYQRVEVRHSVVELEAYKTNVLATTDQLLTAVERLDRGDDPQHVAYPTRTRDCAYDCDFLPVCSMFDDGSRVEDALAALYERVEPLDRYEPRLAPQTPAD